jgi:hypothetical protein
MIFTIEFFKFRGKDGAHAMFQRIKHATSDLESAKLKAKSLFATLSMNPDGLRIFDHAGYEVFSWRPGSEGAAQEGHRDD